jgi:hypothetical protein
MAGANGNGFGGRKHTRTSEYAGNIFRGSASLEIRAGSATFLLFRRGCPGGPLEPDADAPATVLVDELDARRPEHLYDGRQGAGISRVSPDLNVGDCVSVKPGRFRQIANRPI